MKKNNEQKKVKHCCQPPVVQKVFDSNVSQHRIGFILSTGLKWVNGTEIKYMFIEGPDTQKSVVRNAFRVWKDLGIGISFKEVTSVEDSMVRIGFDQGDGSWSYVGRENLTIPINERTMNFGWDLTADSYGMTTALHEIGHAIGFQHEHQSPFSGIKWDTIAVYAAFSGPPNNWSKPKIDVNIINKLPANQVQGSTWDPKSIMEYQFDAGLILQPEEYKNGVYPPGVLSSNDIKGVKSFYPVVSFSSFKKLEIHKSVIIKAASGEQDDFVFKAPSTKQFTFQTIGDLDTTMVITEKGKTENHYMAGDDDSGTEKNSKITLPLVKGREYLINIRVMYSPNSKSGSIIIS